MKILYSETLDEICIQRCFGLDGVVQIPERVAGRPVRELGPYLFSQSMERALAARGGLKGPLYVWDCELGGPELGGLELGGPERDGLEPGSPERGGPELGSPGTENCGGLPAVSGGRVRELWLPPGVAKVGEYAFYGCENMTVLGCSSDIRDWGAGAFTGCTGMRKISMRMVPDEKSSLKEILFEMRQTLELDYLDRGGELMARLIFPEFYEDAVENTPARFIMREMHGCGHMYRYCFDDTAFSFREYDRLFDNVHVQEGPGLSARLAVYRLYWPFGLTAEAETAYWSYIEAHAVQAAQAVMEEGDSQMAGWLAQSPGMGRPQLDEMIGEAGRREDTQMMALFMDVLHRRFGSAAPARRKFEL